MRKAFKLVTICSYFLCFVANLQAETISVQSCNGKLNLKNHRNVLYPMMST